MIIYLAKDASLISEHLHDAVAKGWVGVYRARSEDDRAVRAAAALVLMRVFIVNTFLVRLSIAQIVLGSCLMLVPGAIDLADEVFCFGLITSIISITLDCVSVGGKRKQRSSYTTWKDQHPK